MNKNIENYKSIRDILTLREKSDELEDESDEDNEIEDEQSDES